MSRNCVHEMKKNFQKIPAVFHSNILKQNRLTTLNKHMTPLEINYVNHNLLCTLHLICKKNLFSSFQYGSKFYRVKPSHLTKYLYHENHHYESVCL